jgi:hypothetical protein
MSGLTNAQARYYATAAMILIMRDHAGQTGRSRKDRLAAQAPSVTAKAAHI